MPGSAGAVRAGKAYYELYAENSLLAKGMKQAEQIIKGGFSTAFSGAKGALSSAGAAITKALTSPLTAIAAVAAPIAASKLFAEMGAELIDVSRRTGASADALGLFAYAAKQTGSDLPAVEGAITSLRDKIVDAARGSDQSQLAFARLGINFLALSRMKPEDQFRLIADRLNLIPNQAIRAAAAMELFGTADLNPMVARLGDLEDKAKRLGLTLSNEDAQSAKTFSEALTDLKQNLLATAGLIGAKIAPVAAELINRWVELSSHTRQWISANADIFGSVNTLWSFLKLKWAEGSNFLMEKWDEISDYLSSAWNSLTDEFDAVWNQLTAAIIGQWNASVGGLQSAWVDLQSRWIDLNAQIQSAWAETTVRLSSFWDNFANGVSIWFNVMAKGFQVLTQYAGVLADVLGAAFGPQIQLLKQLGKGLTELGGIAARAAGAAAVDFADAITGGDEVRKRQREIELERLNRQAGLKQPNPLLLNQPNAPGLPRAPGPNNVARNQEGLNRFHRIQDLQGEYQAALEESKKKKTGETPGAGGPTKTPEGVNGAMFQIQGLGATDIRTKEGFASAMKSLRQQSGSPELTALQNQLMWDQKIWRETNETNKHLRDLNVRGKP